MSSINVDKEVVNQHATKMHQRGETLRASRQMISVAGRTTLTAHERSQQVLNKLQQATHSSGKLLETAGDWVLTISEGFETIDQWRSTT